MPDRPPRALPDLYSLMAAHLQADEAGTALLAAEAVASGAVPELVAAAVMTAGECLREVASARNLSGPGMVRLLVRAHRELAETPDGIEERVLRSVGQYLAGERTWCEHPDAAWLGVDAHALVLGATRVAGAALAWRSRDVGADPVRVCSNACLTLAGRLCSAAA